MKKLLKFTGIISFVLLLAMNLNISNDKTANTIQLQNAIANTTYPNCIVDHGKTLCCRWYIDRCYYTDVLSTMCTPTACYY